MSASDIAAGFFNRRTAREHKLGTKLREKGRLDSYPFSPMLVNCFGRGVPTPALVDVRCRRRPEQRDEARMQAHTERHARTIYAATDGTDRTDIADRRAAA
jgi:hypothetical protein